MSCISIFIPVFNGGEYLEQTIHSILEQSLKDFEVLFVDDGSSDNSIEIIEKYVQCDKRFKLYQKEHEGSVPYSWKWLIERDLFNSDWILYMSQDDLLHPNLLEELSIKQKRSGANVIIPSCHFFSHEFNEKEFQNLNKKNDMSNRATSAPISGKEAFELMFDYGIPGFALWSKKLIFKYGMPTDAFNSDELMQRLWVLGSDCVSFIGTPIYYRQRQGSIGCGIKPQSFYSLISEMKLLKEGKVQRINNYKIYKAQYKSLFWTLWLYSYLKAYPNSFPANDCQELKGVLNHAYTYFRQQLPLPRTFKDLMLWCTAKTSKVLYIALYSMYLRDKLDE